MQSFNEWLKNEYWDDRASEMGQHVPPPDHLTELVPYSIAKMALKAPDAPTKQRIEKQIRVLLRTGETVDSIIDRAHHYLRMMGGAAAKSAEPMIGRIVFDAAD